MIWPYIFISYLSLFVFGLCDNVRGPLFPEIMKDFAVNDSMGSWMYALSSISGFISSYLCRYLLRRYNRRAVLQGGAIALILAMIGLACAPYFWFFLICSFIFGLSLGIVGLVPNVLVPLGSSSERKQQLVAGLHAMYGVASLMSPLLAAGIEYLTGSWRWTFVVATIAPLSLIFYSLHSSHRGIHKRSEHTAETHKLNRKKNLKPQLFLALMVSFCVAAEIMISSRLALYMRRAQGYDMEASSLYVTYFFVCMLIGRSMFAIVKFPTSIRNQLSVSTVLSAIFIFLGIHVHPLFLAAVGFTVAPFYPMSITWISSKFPHDLDTAVSYMMTTDSVMLVVMHLLVGKVTDEAGIGNALYLGPLFLLLSFILVNTFEAIFEKKPEETASV
ncbi:sugar MFS transporter [Bdellovibrio sp. NC01]|uniref:MFS transporter n=1 Tax=Bdellovibrio sp. NC01 TaxID=2220073 RepID=UPI0011571BA0|nr:MFS transporter [Bdellovibrio sp. NC01]QDK37138.1 MFS transporter [Bdellovibrio sp. NC01]